MCDTLVTIAPGRVWFAKNSDRDPNEAQVPTWRPARDHVAGAPLRCTHVTIPQVAHTHAVLLSRPFWLWGAEMGANAHGVVIGNEAVFTDQPFTAGGLTGMDLVRLGLERGATAAEAVAVIEDLVARHGQGGGCGHEHPGFRYHASFLIADARGAFVVETAGRAVAFAPVADAATISNALTLPALRGHRDPLRSWVAAADRRQACTLAAARGARGVSDLFAALRDHGDGGGRPRYRWHHGAMAAPCMHAGGLVAASQTTASWVAELTPAGARHWITATAAPCLSIFKPVAVDDPLDLGPPPRDRADAGLWWQHERLHRRVIGDAAWCQTIAAERDRVERGWLAAPPTPAAAFAAHRALIDRWLAASATAAPVDDRPWYVRRYWAARDRRAGLA